MSDKIKPKSKTKTDLTGQRFGRLFVIEEGESQRDTQGHLRRFWICKCDCGNIKVVKQHLLTSNQTKSCGCLDRERRLEGSKKRITENTYEIKDTYCVVKDIIGRTFIIDKDDLSKVKQRYWHVRKDGYVYSRHRGSKALCDSPQIALHEFLTGERYVDHINKDPSDNRRVNLRTKKNCSGEATNITNQGLNNFNHKLRSDNKSGVAGVRYDEKTNKWGASIYINGKPNYLGYFESKEDAINMRRLAETYYVGGYSSIESERFAKENKLEE